MSVHTALRALSIASLWSTCGAPSPAQSLVWQVPGDARQDHLGASVAYLPDVDGDGVVDVLVGSPSDPFTGIPGRAAIFSGASRKQLFEWVGDGLGDALGASVASLGDVDGDGVADVAIGARFRSVGSAQGGAVFTYSGATGALLFSYLNATAHASLGASVAGLGDVDGDGFGDCLVGSPYDVPTGTKPSGAAFVFRGNDLWLDAYPKSVAAGATESLAIHGVPFGRPAALFVVAIGATPTFQLAALGVGDAVEAFTVAAIVPVGLAGSEWTLRAYALDANGRLIDSADEGVVFD